MGERHSRQNRFAGQTKAGKKYRRPSGTETRIFSNMGQLGHCWCGEKYGHDWPGKDSGAPHPREA